MRRETYTAKSYADRYLARIVVVRVEVRNSLNRALMEP